MNLTALFNFAFSYQTGENQHIHENSLLIPPRNLKSTVMQYYNQYPQEDGLGDLLFKIYHGDFYGNLEQLEPSDRLHLYLGSHNPYSRELYQFHPRAGQMEVRQSGDQCFCNKILQMPGLDRCNETGWKKLYYSESDKKILSETALKKDYIVLNVTGSGLNKGSISNERDIPNQILDKLVSTINDLGLSAILVGRTYQIKSIFNNERIIHKEPEIKNALSLVDRLSVPGVIELIRNANGCILSHSSMMLPCWWLNIPNLILYPAAIEKRLQQSIETDQYHKYFFGFDLPMTVHSRFDDFSDQDMTQFINLMT